MGKSKAYGICLYIKYNSSYKILLCQSIDNITKWGFLKGTKRGNETPRKAAVREFLEESGIRVEKKYLEHFFYQKNRNKDVGIFMLDGATIANLDSYFEQDRLKQKYICTENERVHWFDIDELPHIKKKQLLLISKVLYVLREKSEFQK